MTRILLVRHGETEWNAAGRVQGWTDSRLSDRGRAQADRLAQRLAPSPLAAVYASDLSRAQETAQIIAQPQSLPVMTDARLRERGYGAWEGLTLSELETQFPEAWHRYHHQRALDVPIPGGETWEQVSERILPALHDLLAQTAHETIVFVGHGGSLRALILDALAAPLTTLLRLRLDNASLTRLDYPTERAGQVIFLNDTSHLEGLD